MAESEVLLINPRRRRKARKNPGRRSAAQRAATRALVALNRRRRNPSRRARRRNPVAISATPYINPRRRRRSRRRSNPAALYRPRIVARRRRNPLPSMSGVMAMIQGAAIQGAGAVAVDFLYAKVTPYLPASLRIIPGAPGLGDAAKAIGTAFLGRFLNRFTKGYSGKAAEGALTVQFHGLVTNLLPAGTIAGRLGYVVPTRVVNGNARVNLNRMAGGQMGRFTAPGASAVLSAFNAPGYSPVLSDARSREGFMR